MTDSKVETRVMRMVDDLRKELGSGSELVWALELVLE